MSWIVWLAYPATPFVLIGVAWLFRDRHPYSNPEVKK